MREGVNTMKNLIVLTTIVLLTGCGSLQEVGENALVKGARINDSALVASEAVICRGASVGAILRKYGQDKTKARAWRDLCVESNPAAADIIAP